MIAALWIGVVLQTQSAADDLPAGAIPSARFAPGALHRARFASVRDERLAELRAAGAVRFEHDYGGFVLAAIDERRAGGEEALRASGLEWHDEHDLVALNGFLLDTARPRETLARLRPSEALGDPLDASLDPDAGLYLLQFVAPPRDEWREALVAAGVELVQYVPRNAYVVAIEPARVAGAQALAAASAEVRYLGVFEPGFRMTPDVRAIAAGGASGPVPVTVQLVRGPEFERARADLATLCTRIVSSTTVGPYENVRCDVDAAYLAWLAARPAVFAIEPARPPERLDERQGQIVAANVAGAAPSAPGYLAWLAARGFGAGQFGTFSVNVVDDASSLSGHPDLDAARVAFVFNPTGQSGPQGGHGFLNAHVIAGFNSGSGAALEDAGGYNYGLGIAPWARVGSTAIFGGGPLDPVAWEDAAYGAGARISSNSWGTGVFAYDSLAQAYDVMVRDARAGVAGHQAYTLVFGVGNEGPGANTVFSPSSAKNVIGVGASENNRQTGTDGCGWSNAAANDLRDVASFSSRGPVNAAGGDGRTKPDLLAPGTHVQAGVPQSSYDGSTVCNPYFPLGQTLYSWGSGTSHSTPAVAGGCALIRQWFLNQGRAAPSPAMTKAVLVGCADHMPGVGANDTLPSPSQGFGRMALARAFDDAPRLLLDQESRFASTGQAFTTDPLLSPGLGVRALPLVVADPSKPVRVALVWTDAPGSTVGAPFVNDLDLTVVVGATTYKGNVFSGATSIPGGTADIRNNVECVFLPPGTAGSIVVRVVASAIVGDGVPGNGDPTDQDFALFVYNVGPKARRSQAPGAVLPF